MGFFITLSSNRYLWRTKLKLYTESGFKGSCTFVLAFMRGVVCWSRESFGSPVAQVYTLGEQPRETKDVSSRALRLHPAGLQSDP